jgi:hypothetical protein
MWEGIVGIVAEIKRCESAGATMAAITVAYVCIDTMAFLSMPAGQTWQTRNDFIAWVNTYLKADHSQRYQYAGADVYAARCSVLHTFGAEAELHQKDHTIRKFGYHNGGLHVFNPDVSPNLVIIGVASFLNDVAIAVDSFMRGCEGDAALRDSVESRLPKVFQTLPFPHGGVIPRS